ncbi:LysE/ArgO family amino acid transporter [Nocardia blacklockiae]|uniref:LysE/ArgO family amino acid transporter n=1 Tax=Nocardia blacklockiae TaxID=480036 RepID=UPI001894BC77|nr:LysE/ArgO family amino acid transporter [Nocardia blacklockiae]MBF6173043.1 amino acid transporter [Nocardia blacklockiae]
MNVSAVLPGLGFGLSLIVAIGAQNAFVLRRGIHGTHILAVIAVCTLSDVVLIAAGVGGLGAFLASAPVLMEVVRYTGAAFLLGYAALAVRRVLSPTVLTAADESATKDSSNPMGTTHPAGSIAPNDRPHQEGGPDSGNMSPIAAGPVGAATSLGTARFTTVLTPSAAASKPQMPQALPALIPTVLTCLALTWLNPHVYLDTVVLMGSFANTYGPDRWAFTAGAMLASVLWFTALGYGSRLLAPVFARPAAWRVLDAAIALIMVTLGVSLVLR